jgi:hypothetical protein
VQEIAQCLLLRFGQRHQEGSDGRQTLTQELLPESIALLGEVKCDGSLVEPGAALNKAIGHEPIDKAHRPGVREAEDPPQLIVRGTETVPDDDQGGGRFADAVQNPARRLLDAIRDGEPHSPE